MKYRQVGEILSKAHPNVLFLGRMTVRTDSSHGHTAHSCVIFNF